MYKNLILIGIILLAFSLGCNFGGENENTNMSQRDIEEAEKNEIGSLKLERNIEQLKRSDVQVAPIAGSETGGDALASTLESTEVENSELNISKTLSDLDAKQTDEGLVINLPENILFDFDKSEIKNQAEPTLRKINELLKYYKDSPMQINGHTDSKGSDSYNQQLSEKRANAVKEYLAKNFEADANRLKTKGFGESKPIAENEANGADNPEGREKNRRVEVIIENAKKPTENK